jgi:hypothetical protein
MQMNVFKECKDLAEYLQTFFPRLELLRPQIRFLQTQPDFKKFDRFNVIKI